MLLKSTGGVRLLVIVFVALATGCGETPDVEEPEDHPPPQPGYVVYREPVADMRQPRFLLVFSQETGQRPSSPTASGGHLWLCCATILSIPMDIPS
jgi:hypothetical protein